MKIYIIQEKVDSHTYFDLYETKSKDFALQLLRANKEKHSTKCFRLIEILR